MDTIPVMASTLRILAVLDLSKASEMNILPEGSKITPFGWHSRRAEAGPPTPEVPHVPAWDPATVVMVLATGDEGGMVAVAVMKLNCRQRSSRRSLMQGLWRGFKMLRRRCPSAAAAAWTAPDMERDRCGCRCESR